MIKKLRKKFIIAAMCAILIVLESMILAVNIVNYHHLVEKADTLTEWITNEGGSFGDAAGDRNGNDPGSQPGQDQNEQPPEKPDGSNPDTTPLEKPDILQ